MLDEDVQSERVRPEVIEALEGFESTSLETPRKVGMKPGEMKEDYGPQFKDVSLEKILDSLQQDIRDAESEVSLIALRLDCYLTVELRVKLS